MSQKQEAPFTVFRTPSSEYLFDPEAALIRDTNLYPFHHALQLARDFEHDLATTGSVREATQILMSSRDRTFIWADSKDQKLVNINQGAISENERAALFLAGLNPTCRDLVFAVDDEIIFHALSAVAAAESSSSVNIGPYRVELKKIRLGNARTVFETQIGQERRQSEVVAERDFHIMDILLVDKLFKNIIIRKNKPPIFDPRYSLAVAEEGMTDFWHFRNRVGYALHFDIRQLGLAVAEVFWSDQIECVTAALFQSNSDMIGNVLQGLRSEFDSPDPVLKTVVYHYIYRQALVQAMQSLERDKLLPTVYQESLVRLLSPETDSYSFTNVMRVVQRSIPSADISNTKVMEIKNQGRNPYDQSAYYLVHTIHPICSERTGFLLLCGIGNDILIWDNVETHSQLNHVLPHMEMNIKPSF